MARGVHSQLTCSNSVVALILARSRADKAMHDRLMSHTNSTFQLPCPSWRLTPKTPHWRRSLAAHTRSSASLSARPRPLVRPSARLLAYTHASAFCPEPGPGMCLDRPLPMSYTLFELQTLYRGTWRHDTYPTVVCRFRAWPPCLRRNSASDRAPMDEFLLSMDGCMILSHCPPEDVRSIGTPWESMSAGCT